MAKKAKRKRDFPRLKMDERQKEEARKMMYRMLVKERQKITDDIIDAIFFCLLASVYDEIECDAKTLRMIAEKAMFQFECVNAGTVQLEDFKFLLKDEIGFELKTRSDTRAMLPNIKRVKRLETLIKKMDEYIEATGFGRE